MADSLQRKYRDYRSKNRNVFRAKVRKAYDEITENLVKHTEGLWQDDDEIDLEVFKKLIFKIKNNCFAILKFLGCSCVHHLTYYIPRILIIGAWLFCQI